MPRFSNGVFAPYFVPGASVPVVPSISNGQGLNGVGVYFLDGANGNDGYDGSTPVTAFKTLDKAYSACLGGHNEIIYVLGSATSVNFSSKIASGGSGLVWAKTFTHLIGLCAPGMIGQRARISNGASTNLYTPLINVTGTGCVFQNLEFFNGGAHATQAAVCIAVNAVRTTFINCQISGGGHATAAGNAAMRSLTIGVTTNSDECYFNHCYIGLDTIARTTTSVECAFGATGSARVAFEGCAFSTYATGSGSGAFFLSAGATSIDRFLLFRSCQFLNSSTLSGGVALTAALSVNASPGGVVLLTGCLFVGATGLSASDAAIFSDNAYAAATTGKGVNLSW